MKRPFLAKMYVDTFDLEQWSPDTPKEFAFTLVVEVGYHGAEGISRFFVDVASPDGLAKRTDSILSTRALIVMAKYDYTTLEECIKRIVSDAARTSADEVCTVLNRYFIWECEDFDATVQQDERWGINLGRVQCPACGSPQPRIRIPLNKRQALWGGLTCRQCGTELDKWGKSVAS